MIKNESETPVVLPTINRAVHYVSAGSADGRFPSVCRAAIVTEVPDAGSQDAEVGRVGLVVMNPTGFFFHPIKDNGSVYDGDTKKPCTWHWPERA